MVKRSFLFFIALFSALVLQAQSAQVVKGVALDAQSLSPIPGITVVVLDSDPVLGAVSDADGTFRINGVPLGRHSLRFTCVGYQEAVASNLLISAGKETVMEIKMEESTTMMEDLEIRAGESNPFEVSNELATVSARMFNVDETRRYAGSFGDPSRMAANYAGVSGMNDSRNDIIIRGNSPAGLLWRLEGLDIPNPNHFGAVGSTGGPVSMLNNNLLADSEFYTGAFPSMYGNAISGVFDLQLRKGNNEKTEFLGQLGFNGVEAGIEGPLRKGGKSSYLANYRYSIPALIGSLSPGTGAAIPYYQDLAFHLNFPTKNGRFSVVGLGGLSRIDLLGSETSAEEAKKDLYGDLSYDIYNTAKMGVVSASYLHFINKDTFWKNIVSASYAGFGARLDTVIRDHDLEISAVDKYGQADNEQEKFVYNTQFNKKIGPRNTLTAGAIVSMYSLDMSRKNILEDSDMNEIDFDGSTILLQGYAGWLHKFTDRWIMNLGMHYQHLTLNDNSRSLEPRAGLKYQFNPRQSISIGYGRHSQMQSLEVYFVQKPTSAGPLETNRNLGFTISDHFVAAFDWQIRPDLRLKAEAYYQDISDAAVERTTSYFSMLNAGADFGFPDNTDLVNEGSGFNKGVELTIEKYLNNSYYFLVTGSLFDSKYKGSDGILRNTAFNGNYAFNALFGKEWKVGKKNNAITLDGKFTLAGNRRYIPIDIDASIEQGSNAYRYELAYDRRYPDYMRTDIKIGFRKQHKRITEEFALDVQNMFDNKNVYRESFNVLTGAVGTSYQMGAWPMALYRILF